MLKSCGVGWCGVVVSHEILVLGLGIKGSGPGLHNLNIYNILYISKCNN